MIDRYYPVKRWERWPDVTDQVMKSVKIDTYPDTTYWSWRTVQTGFLLDNVHIPMMDSFAKVSFLPSKPHKPKLQRRIRLWIARKVLGYK